GDVGVRIDIAHVLGRTRLEDDRLLCDGRIAIIVAAVVTAIVAAAGVATIVAAVVTVITTVVAAVMAVITAVVAVISRVAGIRTGVVVAGRHHHAATVRLRRSHAGGGIGTAAATAGGQRDAEEYGHQPGESRFLHVLFTGACRRMTPARARLTEVAAHQGALFGTRVNRVSAVRKTTGQPRCPGSSPWTGGFASPPRDGFAKSGCGQHCSAASWFVLNLPRDIPFPAAAMLGAGRGVH